MPDGDFFAFGEYDGGLLRLIYAVIWENKGTVTMNSFNTIQKTWVRTEGVEGAIADFVCFHCPLVASAEAKPPAAHGAVNSSSIPFALIVSGRRSIHTAIISTDA